MGRESEGESTTVRARVSRAAGACRGAPRVIGSRPLSRLRRPSCRVRRQGSGVRVTDPRPAVADTSGRRCHRPWAPPSPAPPLLRWLGLRLRRVARAVGPVDESGVQDQGWPDIALRVRDAEHRSPVHERRQPRLPIGPPRPNHVPEDPFVVLLGHPPPSGQFPVPPHDTQKPITQTNESWEQKKGKQGRMIHTLCDMSCGSMKFSF